MPVDVHLVPELATHPVLDRLRLPRVYPRGHHAPRGRFVSVRPVHGPEAWEPSLQRSHHSIAPPDLGPAASVDVEAEDARHLARNFRGACRAIDLATDGPRIVLLDAHADRSPPLVGQEGKVEVPARRTPLRRLVPRPD